jgi:ABC-type Fe3+-hydroxamate transport system substrate-binding protein
VTITDALGRALELNGPPSRVVSLVPSLTEFVWEIGAAERLVGRTDFCTEPAGSAALPAVGGTKNPDIAAISALRPDLVLAAKEENTLRVVRALESAGVPVYVTNIETVAQAHAQLSDLARLLGARSGARPLLDTLQAAVWQALGAPAPTRRPRVVAFVWRDPWMAVGDETYANDLMSLCGGTNVALELAGRYPRAPLDAFMRLNPDIILLPDEPYRFSAADEPAFAVYGDVPAVLRGGLYLLDGKLLTWYGRRTAAAITAITAAFGTDH